MVKTGIENSRSQADRDGSSRKNEIRHSSSVVVAEQKSDSLNRLRVKDNVSSISTFEQHGTRSRLTFPIPISSGITKIGSKTVSSQTIGRGLQKDRLTSQHATLPKTLLLLLHPVQTFFLERQEFQLEAGWSWYLDWFDGLDVYETSR